MAIGTLLAKYRVCKFLPADPAQKRFHITRTNAGSWPDSAPGDSRDNSFDSRYFGLVDREQIVGRASRVLVSLDKNHHYVPRLGRSLSLLDQ
jgi:signal peptidase I